MTFRDDMNFQFSNEDSEIHGLYNVSTNAGLFEEPISGNRSIEEDEDISGRRYLKRIRKEPLEFPVSFFFRDKFDQEKIRKTARWLLQDTYKPLVFKNNPNRVMYGVFLGTPQLVHNGLEEGYLTLNFRCNTYHAYTNAERSQMYDFSSNVLEGTNVTWTNKGDFDCRPILYIRKVGDGDISIINYSDGGRELKLTNLVDGEELEIDGMNEELNTNSGFNRHNDYNHGWLNLVYGDNSIKVLGNCEIYYLAQYNIY